MKMILKIRSLVVVLLLIILFPQVVYGQYPGVVGDGGVTVNGIFYGEGTAVAAKDNNLILGGINQIGDQNPGVQDSIPDWNPKYKEFANNNKAIYVPTYYTGSSVEDCTNVDLAIKDKVKTDINGLNSPALTHKTYDTIIAYSGGTATAVAAIDGQNVMCNTLILISPMKGTLSDEDYRQTIQRITARNYPAVKKIVVIWSDRDTPTGIINSYQANPSIFNGVSDSRIELHKALLKQSGIDGHIEIFFDYAMNNINGGTYTDPQAQSTAKPKSNALQLSGANPSDYTSIWNPRNDARWAAKGLGDMGRPSYYQSQPGTSTYPSQNTPPYIQPGPQPSSIQGTSSSASAQGSESSVVGKWLITRNDGGHISYKYITFRNDGSLTRTEWYTTPTGALEHGEWGSGDWTQNGNSIRLQDDPGEIFEGTINGDTMSGSITFNGRMKSYSAERVSE